MNLLSKFIFLLEKPKVVILFGQAGQKLKEVIFQVLKQHFKVGKEIFIFKFETDLRISAGEKEANFFLRNSSLPILVLTQISDTEKILRAKELAKILSPKGYIILNFDDEALREIKKESAAHILTFGFLEGADFRATDIRLNTETNFKLNYKGNIVPIWLEKISEKEQIYTPLAAICIGTVFGLNLIEISRALKMKN